MSWINISIPKYKKKYNIDYLMKLQWKSLLSKIPEVLKKALKSEFFFFSKYNEKEKSKPNHSPSIHIPKYNHRKKKKSTCSNGPV